MQNTLKQIKQHIQHDIGKKIPREDVVNIFKGFLEELAQAEYNDQTGIHTNRHDEITES